MSSAPNKPPKDPRGGDGSRRSSNRKASTTSNEAAETAKTEELTKDNLRRLSDAASAPEAGRKEKEGKTTEKPRESRPGERESGDSTSSVEVDITEQPRDFLIQRVTALERQLRIRNSDCSRLLQERHGLLPLKQKCESQAEMIEALQDKVALLEAQRVSALETIEQLKKQIRDQTHNDRVKGFERRMGSDGDYHDSYNTSPPAVNRLTQGPQGRPVGGDDAAAAGGGGESHQTTNNNTSNGSTSKVRVTGITSGTNPRPQQQRLAPGGTIVNTRAGPEIIYDSSDISSVGFTQNAKLPYDFLGGPAAQQQYYRSVRQPQGASDKNNSGSYQPSNNAFDDGEGAEVSRVMEMAKEQAEMDVKYAEVEAREEQELRARIAALKKK